MSDTETTTEVTPAELAEITGFPDVLCHIVEDAEARAAEREGRLMHALCGVAGPVIPPVEPAGFIICPRCEEVAEAEGITVDV